MKNRILILLAALAVAIITVVAVFQIGETSRPDDKTALDSWLVECPDCRVRVGGMTDRSLRLDTNNNPHIVFGVDHLYYIYYDGSQWQKEIIDASLGDKTSVALFLDTEGKEHISYFDNRSFSVKYAARTIWGWQIETVASSLGETGGGTSIAVNPAGAIYISYFDRTTQTLKYATRTLGGWSAQIVDTGLGTHGGNSSLVLDENYYAHLSYNDYDDQDLKYAYQDGTGWHIQTVDDSGNYPNHSSIDLDTNSYPHISYYSGDMGLNYAYQDPTGWHAVVIDDLDSLVGQWSSIELNQNNYPYISYVSHAGTPNAALKMSFQGASGWNTITVDNNGYAGFWSSLALDSNDHPRIAYYGDPFNTDFDLDGDLRYAQFDGNDWQVMAIARGGDIGGFNSLALDENDNVHMSYYDGTMLYDGDLKYALKDPTGWFTETIDYLGDVGEYNTIDVDSNGFPHIGYMDSSNQDLKYAYLDSAGWHTELVDSIGDVGYDASLSMDLNDLGVFHLS